jgi:hypothetical protein
MRPAARAGEDFLAGHEVRRYKRGGWHVYIRGTKIRVAKIFPAAIGLARALMDVCDWKEACKAPKKKYKRTGKYRGITIRGRYIPVAERRAKLAASNSGATDSETRANPATSMHEFDVPNIDKPTSVSSG